MAQKKGPLTEKKYLDALAKNHLASRTKGIDATMKKYRLDAIVAPTGAPAWTTDLVNGDHFTGGELDAGGRRRLSEHQRSGGICVWPSGGHLLHGQRVERADAHQDRVRVRAGNASPPSAAIHSDAGTGDRQSLRTTDNREDM